jgi:5'(3')-deoxyribonucleotidase
VSKLESKTRLAASSEPSPAKFVFGVDLDGVCVDFYGSLRPIAAEWLGIPERKLTQKVTYGLPEWNLEPMGGYDPLHRFAVTQKQRFARADPIPGAAAALRRLDQREDIRIRIITNRLFIKFFHQQAVQQTVEWLDRHGIPYWDLCLLGDKAAVGADLYIDDTPHNVEALRAKDLRTIVFTNSTNRGVDPPRADNWEEVEALVLEELANWKTRPDAERPPAGH